MKIIVREEFIMIRRIMVILFAVFIATIVFAMDETTGIASQTTNTALSSTDSTQPQTPSYVRKFTIGYNGGLNFGGEITW
jgi:uncharacterized protein (UPF0333 family)